MRSRGGEILVLLLAGLGVAACTVGPEVARDTRPIPQAVEPPPTPEVAKPLPEIDEPADTPVLIGSVVKITDGDTIKVQLSSGPISVRFHSIDAPERDQPWGAEATAALASRLAGQVVDLEVVEQDWYERLVAVVYVNDENMNAWLVQQGHAWAYRDYLEDPQYCAWEGVARTSGRGLWALPRSERHAPWEWRAVKRDGPQPFSDFTNETVANCIAAMPRSGRARGVGASVAKPVQVSSPPPGACHIKGNISDSGRIYHVPGSPAYERTKIDEAKGERWFCSEAEARAAGWRAPRG
jgi:endonuclease YncB( thermonuclease family)